MMKVGIITITKGYNYGNRLQNYAVQHIIENLGYETETLHNNEKIPTNFDKVKLLIKKSLIGSRYWNKVQKVNKFNEFNRKYIKMSKLYISNNSIPDGIEKIDLFVCGSDQIWNPMFKENGRVNFLDFAPKEKRIAFSPSFGTEFVPDSRKSEFKEYINGIPYLSVREKAGSDIIKDLTGRSVEVLLDPTLTLTKEEWIAVSEATSLKPKKDYILTYFLGKITDEYKRYIDDIASDNDLEIINLNDINNSKYYSVSPSEFIYLINNSSFVCTDSFHGTVFSIIMEVPFLVFNRVDKNVSMNSRFTNLLKKLDMESRFFNITEGKDIFRQDFSYANDTLEKERKKAYNYISNAINSINQ